MTVSATTETRKQYTGNASYTTSTDFTAAFKYLDTSEIKVTHTNASTSADTAYVEGTHYSVQSGAAATSVTIRFLTSYVPTATTEYVTIYRETAFSQLTDYTEGSALDAETLEQNFDKAIMLVQQVNNNLTDLYIAFSATNDFNTTAAAASQISINKADRSSKYLGFNSDGDISVLAAIAGLTLTETSVSAGDIVVHNGTAYVNSKSLARLSQILDANGNEVIKFGTTGSAVNEITITNSATGDPPTISATGEADKGIDFENSEGEELLKLASVSSAVNEITVTNSATTNGPILSATGGDANVDINLTPKGTGELNVDGKVKSINGQSMAQTSFMSNLILGF
jgi:hypothetical protein